MHTQPDLFLPMCATVRGRQGELFTEADATVRGLSCQECGRGMVRTDSGFLSCPLAHGKLIAEGVRDPEPDDEPVIDDWPEQAREMAKRHAARDKWFGTRWRCECGHCSRARSDGFIPREQRR